MRLAHQEVHRIPQGQTERPVYYARVPRGLLLLRLPTEVPGGQIEEGWEGSVRWVDGVYSSRNNLFPLFGFYDNDVE